jgi:hypothetical protein
MSLRTKFIEGITFGAGFGLAFFVVAWALAWLVGGADRLKNGVTLYSSSTSVSSTSPPAEEAMGGFDIPVEERIKKASFIALARFEPSPDGRQRAIIKEFLKETPGALIHYKVGDEYAPGSFYPQAGQERGDGVVVFFVGSPASMRFSSNYHGDRIGTFGDMPLDLFRRKCRGEA